MNRDTLTYFEDILMNSVVALQQATQAPEDISDDNFKRVLNVQLEAIKANVANIQHLLET